MHGKRKPHVHPITDQPRLPVKIPGLTDKTANTVDEEKLRGISPLSISNFITIEIEKRPCSCDWDAHYVVKNSNRNLIFTAIEELHCCYFGSLKNVIIFDTKKDIIGRVCYKEKSCISGDMAIGVYSPPDILLAAVVEVSSCVSNSSFFRISDSEGQRLFQIKYGRGLCSQLCGCPATFTITSEENQSEVAEIVEKTARKLSLHFKGKLSITSKLILTGFCLGLAHKAYKQKSTRTATGNEQHS